MESPADYMDSPDAEDVAYPCKGCGDVSDPASDIEWIINMLIAWCTDPGGRQSFRTWYVNIIFTLTSRIVQGAHQTTSYHHIMQRFISASKRPSSEYTDTLLAGNRWHLNCFRCNTCGTLLDSDANLLLLGDGSLICNNCTYSCSACGNKIEDLAILTGDQAFCATCFRCRNCKRKIENLRYARTSQGIFCMSCHESLMARRRKKSRAAANAKVKKDDGMLVDKSLPALPPSAKPTSSMTTSTDSISRDTDTPTELSPRPPPNNSRNGSSSRSSSKRPQEQSPERNSSEVTSREGLGLPPATYRRNRHSAISQASDIMNGGDADSFYIPLALDPSPASTITPPTHPANEPWSEPSQKKSRETKAQDKDKDYFNAKNSGKTHHEGQFKVTSREHSASPHIAFQEKGRQPSTDEAMQIKDSIRKAQAAGTRGESSRSTPSAASSETKVQHADSAGTNGLAKGKSDRFRLGDVPKGKRSASSRSESLSELPGDSARASTLSELPGDDGKLRLSELAGDTGTPGSVTELPAEDTTLRTNSHGGLSDISLRKDSGLTSKTNSSQSHLNSSNGASPRSSSDLKLREETTSRPSSDTRDLSTSVPLKKDSGGGEVNNAEGGSIEQFKGASERPGITHG